MIRPAHIPYKKINSNLAHSNEVVSNITELIKPQFLLEDSIE